MNEFSERLKLLRERKDISLSELAIQLGVAKSLLWRYEAGKSEPGLSLLMKLSDYFGVTLDWISGNGETDKIQFTGKEKYNSLINECIKQGIDPEKLEQIIKLMKE